MQQKLDGRVKVFNDSQGCLITFSESSFIECTGAEPLQRCVSEMMNALEPSSSILRITPLSKMKQDIKWLSKTEESESANESICSRILSANNGKHECTCCMIGTLDCFHQTCLIF